MLDSGGNTPTNASPPGAKKTPAQPEQCRANRLADWGGWTRTTNFLINSQAVCQLTYSPSVRGRVGGVPRGVHCNYRATRPAT